MPFRKPVSIATKEETRRPEPQVPDRGSDDSDTCLQLQQRLQEITSDGLTSASALDLISLLIQEMPSASKETIERTKMLDKLLNTARAMMETKLKTQEAVELAARLRELEIRVEELACGAVVGPETSEDVQDV